MFGFPRSFPRVGVLAASVFACVACGSGPTEGPKAVNPALVVGGVPGSTVAPMAQDTPRIPEPKARPSLQVAADEKRDDKPSEDIDPTAPLSEPGPDPMNGTFTLEQALAGLPEKGALVASIKTSKGEMKCKLFDDKAPVAVANFVGLARGVRPFREKGKWTTRFAYDGTIFHRVIKGFMVQGGDPTGTGRGEPGYVFKDELWAGAKHDRAGLLCMANRGPDTNGMQFFVTDAPAPHLDRSYTIFGECSPTSVVHAIANAPTDGGDRPEKEVVIEKVTISR